MRVLRNGVLYEAWQWGGDALPPVAPKWFRQRICRHCRRTVNPNGYFHVHSLTGMYWLGSGDWLLRRLDSKDLPVCLNALQFAKECAPAAAGTGCAAPNVDVNRVEAMA